MLAVSGTSLESRPQPIIIYDRTFRLLQLYCSVLLSNIIRKSSRFPLVNIAVSWRPAGPWLDRSQFYWVTLRKWSLLLCLQTREGFPSPWNTNKILSLRLTVLERGPLEMITPSWWMDIPPSGNHSKIKSFKFLLKNFWCSEPRGCVCVHIEIVLTFFKIF